MMKSKVAPFLAIAALAGLLTGCSSDKKVNLCPGAAALVEASNLTVFPPGAAADPSLALYRVAVSNVTTDCSINGGARTADASLEIHFVATRAPSGEAARYRVPYFVAVRQGPDIQAKKVYWLNFSFAPGQASIAFSQDVASTLVKVAREKQPFDYQVLVGLQLSKEQLEYNRKIGHYGP